MRRSAYDDDLALSTGTRRRIEPLAPRAGVEVELELDAHNGSSGSNGPERLAPQAAELANDRLVELTVSELERIDAPADPVLFEQRPIPGGINLFHARLVVDQSDLYPQAETRLGTYPRRV